MTKLYIHTTNIKYFLFYYVFSAFIWVFILTISYRINIFNPFAFSMEKCKELAKFGGTMAIGTISQMLFVPFNKVMIARYVGISEVTYYQIAVQVVMSIRKLFVSGLQAIMPKISEIYKGTAESFLEVLSIHKKGMLLKR